MIRSFTFTNQFGRSMQCVLRAPELTGLAVKSVTGLGAGNATVNIHEIATSDGGYFGSARYSYRTLTFTFVACDMIRDNVYVSAEDIRHLADEFFAPKTLIQVVVETDTKMLSIEGVVEINNPNIFQQSEDIPVAIKCPGYYFKMVSDTGSKLSSTIYGRGLFEFPFSNESLNRKLIQFGELSLIQKRELYYDGTSDAGFELEIAFTGETVTGFSLQNKPLGNIESGPVGFGPESDASRAVFQWHDTSIVSKYISLNLNTVSTKLGTRYTDPIYSAGNRIVISSRVGKKSAVFIDNNDNRYNILNAFSRLDWLKLYPGHNEFTITTDATSLGHFSITINYEALFSGV